MQRFSLAIDGMHCGGCVDRVTKALNAVPGVTLESVNVGSAAGQYDERATNTNTLVQALEKLGFDARSSAQTSGGGSGCGCGGTCGSK